MESPAPILWDFVDLRLCKTSCFLNPPLKLTRRGFNQSTVPVNNHAGMRFALLLVTSRLASRGGRNRTSTRYRFWGVNTKRGLAPAPFHFQRSPTNCPLRSRQSTILGSSPQNPYWFRLPTSVRPDPLGSGIVCVQQTSPSLDVGFCLTKGMVFLAAKKNERPVGGPAARSWGWRNKVIRKSV